MEKLTYEGSDLGRAVRFQHPQDWKLQTEKGEKESYQAIRLLGPSNPERTYRTLFSVRAEPLQATGGAYASRDEALDKYLKTLFDGAQVERDSKLTIAGFDVRDITVAYTVPPIRYHGLKGVSIPVKSRTVAFESGGMLYTVYYTADAQVFGDYLESFEALLNSFKLL